MQISSCYKTLYVRFFLSSLCPSHAQSTLQPVSEQLVSAVDGSLFLVLEDLVVVPSPLFFRVFFTFVSGVVDSDPRIEFLSLLVRLLSLDTDSVLLLLFFLGLWFAFPGESFPCDERLPCFVLCGRLGEAVDPASFDPVSPDWDSEPPWYSFIQLGAGVDGPSHPMCATCLTSVGAPIWISGSFSLSVSNKQRRLLSKPFIMVRDFEGEK